MSDSLTKVHRLKLDCYDSRKNFPARLARKRGESNFLCAFERSYIDRCQQQGIAASEFALQHFGRADLVWIAWDPEGIGKDFSALALHKQLRRRKLVAFEAKLLRIKFFAITASAELRVCGIVILGAMACVT